MIPHDINYPAVVKRPQNRSDCVGGERPCPFVSCKWHLYLEVKSAIGSIKLPFPKLEVDELVETCALDVADRGGATLEQVAKLMNLTRERIRQLEVRALEKLGVKCLLLDLARTKTRSPR